MSSEARPVHFRGDGGTLFGIMIVNVLLSIVTLGIYSFWGRTRVRQYLWGQTEFEGDRLAYHGTGGELLRGWLKAMGVFLALFVIMMLVQLALDPVMGAILTPLIFWGAILCLTPVILVGTRRYRLTRTSWRGVRFSFRGKAGDFLGPWLGGALLTGITFGLYAPHFHNTVRDFFTRHTWFGTQRFGYDGTAAPVYSTYLKCWLLFPFTLGLSMCWYRAARERHQWAHTAFSGCRFQSSVTGGGLLGQSLFAALLIVVTLGIGTPWAIVRYQKYLMDNLAVIGALDLSAILQNAQAAGAAAEGFADVLDMGGGIEVGL